MHSIGRHSPQWMIDQVSVALKCGFCKVLTLGALHCSAPGMTPLHHSWFSSPPDFQYSNYPQALPKLRKVMSGAHIVVLQESR